MAKEKKESKPKKEINFDKLNIIVGTGKSDNLKKGVEKEVTGLLAEILINKGFAKLK